MYSTYLRWLARWRLIKRQRYLQEVNKIMEEYLTQKIMNDDKETAGKRRQELLQKQAEISTGEEFINFLKNL